LAGTIFDIGDCPKTVVLQLEDPIRMIERGGYPGWIDRLDARQHFSLLSEAAESLSNRRGRTSSAEMIEELCHRIDPLPARRASWHHGSGAALRSRWRMVHERREVVTADLRL
jgi:hypothetical protein